MGIESDENADKIGTLFDNWKIEVCRFSSPRQPLNGYCVGARRFLFVLPFDHVFRFT